MFTNRWNEQPIWDGFRKAARILRNEAAHARRVGRADVAERLTQRAEALEEDLRALNGGKQAQPRHGGVRNLVFSLA